MAEFDTTATTSPKIANRSELWYSTDEAGTDLKQIFQIQSIPQFDPAPEPFTYQTLESQSEFATEGIQTYENLDINVNYVEEQHDTLHAIGEAKTSIWIWVKLPDATAVEEGKPLVGKFRATIRMSLAELNTGEILGEILSIFKETVPQYQKGMPDAA